MDFVDQLFFDSFFTSTTSPPPPSLEPVEQENIAAFPPPPLEQFFLTDLGDIEFHEQVEPGTRAYKERSQELRPLRPQSLNFRNISPNSTTTCSNPNTLTTYSPITPLISPRGANDTSSSSYDSNGSLTPGSPTVAFQCPVCPTVLCHKRGYIRHYKRKHCANILPSFPCRICQKPLANPTARLRHEKYHFGVEELSDQGMTNNSKKGFREKCPTCSKIFWDRTLFRRHETVHSEEKPFTCHLCPEKRYKVKSTLTRHMKIVHSQSQPNATAAPCQELIIGILGGVGEE